MKLYNEKIRDDKDEMYRLARIVAEGLADNWS